MVIISISDVIERQEVLDLYNANHWSSADKPAELMAALRNSHSLVTARREGNLVGLANAISDGHLVVYYPHLVVHPDHHGLGIGRLIMDAMFERYRSFHQHALLAVDDAVGFYESVGFVKSEKITPMWIYQGDDC